jgi:hypothetical protein
VLLGERDGEMEGDSEALGLLDGETDGDRDAEGEADGESEGEIEGLSELTASSKIPLPSSWRILEPSSCSKYEAIMLVPRNYRPSILRLLISSSNRSNILIYQWSARRKVKCLGLKMHWDFEKGLLKEKRTVRDSHSEIDSERC